MINATGNRMTREIARQSSLADRIDRLQVQISGGTRILRASDDVVGSRRVATIGKAQASMATWQKNVDTATALVSQADSVLKSASDLMARARELTLSAASDSMSADDRATVAAELAVIADEIDSLASTRDTNGDPLFAVAGARVMRFDSDVTFAPVPSAGDAFVADGTSLATMVRDAAAAVSAGDSAAMGTSLTALATGIGHVADQNAALGLSGARLERIGDGLSSRGIALADERSSVEDTDLTEAIAELNAVNLTLEAAQASFARINRQTLFDILG